MKMEEKYTEKGIQQDNNYREFMTWITDGGLRYAYAKQTRQPEAEKLYRQQVAPNDRRHVIVVGAGMAGLSAAYELSQVGHNVTILEAEGRVGGRIKTCREGFADGLYSEAFGTTHVAHSVWYENRIFLQQVLAGAMRLCYSHYLSKHYTDMFRLKTKTFQNRNDRAYIYRYGEKVTIKDWEEKNDVYSDKWFPGWDDNLTIEVKEKLNIKGILNLYERTIAPVIEDLGQNPTELDWHRWDNKWGKLSINDFLICTTHQLESDPQLRPWPNAAIDAFKFSICTFPLSHGLATYTRLKMAKVFENPVYTLTDGMDTLPIAFLQKNTNGWNKDVVLRKNIKFGVRVERVIVNNSFGNQTVTIEGMNTSVGQKISVEGDAVVLAVPFSILRKIEVPLALKKRKALENLIYYSGTKIMLQCKSRFWQKDVGLGGSSRTDMEIGELHYPDFDGSDINTDERGILMIYKWTDSNLAFNTTSDNIIREALRQISKLHPDVVEEFEVGKVQVWGNEANTQGGVVEIKPGYMEGMEILTTPTQTIYIAGDTLSWTNGWIQGAIFSGLMQAFCFQAHVENHQEIWNPVTMLFSETDGNSN